MEFMTGILAALDLTPQDCPMIVVGTLLLYMLYRALSTKLFKPMLEHIERREEATTGVLQTAAQMRQKGEALQLRHNEALFQARVEANQQKNEILTAAKERAAAIIAAAEASAAVELKGGRAAIQEQVSAAQLRAESEAVDLAERLASRVNSQLGAQ